MAVSFHIVIHLSNTANLFLWNILLIFVCAKILIYLRRMRLCIAHSTAIINLFIIRCLQHWRTAFAPDLDRHAEWRNERSCTNEHFGIIFLVYRTTSAYDFSRDENKKDTAFDGGRNNAWMFSARKIQSGKRAWAFWKRIYRYCYLRRDPGNGIHNDSG